MWTGGEFQNFNKKLQRNVSYLNPMGGKFYISNDMFIKSMPSIFVHTKSFCGQNFYLLYINLHFVWKLIVVPLFNEVERHFNRSDLACWTYSYPLG